MLKEQKKLSIIVPVYNSEEYLRKCLDRLLEQSYKNIEIIIVNDCSQGDCESIADEYKSKDGRIKYIKHSSNKGLFQTRITGTSIATGEYIAFLDSDDYVSIDYYRTLMDNIQENNSDIAMGNTIIEYDNGERIIYNLFDAKHLELNGEEIFNEYFRQEGLSFDWSVIWNKIYKRSIWEQALKYYKKIDKHLIMTEDIAFSTVLFYFAKKLTKVENDGIFYCKHNKTATSINNLKFNKVEKNIQDLTTVFDFIESFLKETNMYEKYKTKYMKWRSLYSQIQRDCVEEANLSKEELFKTDELLKKFCPNEIKIKNEKFIYSITSRWNEGLEKIKLAICDENIKYVSFDIFDTLIKRPFFIPTDLFSILSRYFRELTNTKTGMDFAKIRIACEQLTRVRVKEKNPEIQEVTLDEIYQTINKEYHIDIDILEKVKEMEISLELRFCDRRNTGYELYGLALAMGKKVICTSDMYLPKEIINQILNKNGYINVEKVYISSEVKLTKATGDLFQYVLNDLKISEKEIIHIGDNWHSDVETPKRQKINSMHLPRAVDVATDTNVVNNLLGMFTKCMPFWRDNNAAMQFIGIRTMIAVFANKYFDNPFKTFNNNTDFNADPYLIGYFALGMYTFGITKWLLDDTQGKGYNKLVFMARDGYLPMNTYKIMKKLYNNVPKEEYLYVSRKALVPVTIIDELDFYKLPEVINVTNHTPRDILIYIKDSITIKEGTFESICKVNDIKLDEKLGNIMNFNKFIKVVIDNFYDKEKHKKNLEALRQYFKGIYGHHSATFDIGYSGRPELFLSNLCGEPIDTYFLNINQEEALRHADIAGFKLNTFFGAKPSATGFTYESMLSALAPSCIGYNIKNDEVTPVFEEYNKNFQEEFVTSIMQNAAIEFVDDMVNIFGKDINYLYYQNYYISLPIMAYINSSRTLDKAIFGATNFEDDVRLKESVSMTKEWDKELEYRNQKTMGELLSKTTNNSGTFMGLENRSRPMKLLFYMLYDRPTFRRRMNEIFGRNKIIYGIGRFFYKVLRKIRNIIYAIVHKIKK